MISRRVKNARLHGDADHTALRACDPGHYDHAYPYGKPARHMQQFEAPVVDVETLTPGLSLVWLAGQPLARLTSGQFVMARCGDGIDPLLRKALSLHRRPRKDGAVGFMFGTAKTWGRWLGSRRPGDTVDVIAPLGKGFVRDKASPACTRSKSSLPKWKWWH